MDACGLSATHFVEEKKDPRPAVARINDGQGMLCMQVRKRRKGIKFLIDPPPLFLPFLLAEHSLPSDRRVLQSRQYQIITWDRHESLYLFSCACVWINYLRVNRERQCTQRKLFPSSFLKARWICIRESRASSPVLLCYSSHTATAGQKIFACKYYQQVPPLSLSLKSIVLHVVRWFLLKEASMKTMAVGEWCFSSEPQLGPWGLHPEIKYLRFKSQTDGKPPGGSSLRSVHLSLLFFFTISFP